MLTKKSFTYKLIVLSIFSFLVYSCQKEIKDKNSEINTQIGFESSNYNVITTSPKNENNEFDYVGYLHNKGLDYMLLNAKDFYNPITKEINKNILKNHFAEYHAVYAGKFIDSINNLTNNSYTYYQEEALNLFSPNSEFLSVLSNIRENLNSNQLEFYNQMMNKIENYSDFIVFKNEIVDIENLIQSSSLTYEEKIPLLVGASVARYSAYYWSTKTILEIREYMGDPNYETRTVGEIVKSDFQGAVAGGVHGLLKGLASGALMFGPGGVVLTCIGNAVVGAIGTSFADLLWAMFWEGMNWLCS